MNNSILVATCNLIGYMAFIEMIYIYKFVYHLNPLYIDLSTKFQWSTNPNLFMISQRSPLSPKSFHSACHSLWMIIKISSLSKIGQRVQKYCPVITEITQSSLMSLQYLHSAISINLLVISLDQILNEDCWRPPQKAIYIHPSTAWFISVSSTIFTDNHEMWYPQFFIT